MTDNVQDSIDQIDLNSDSNVPVENKPRKKLLLKSKSEVQNNQNLAQIEIEQNPLNTAVEISSTENSELGSEFIQIEKQTQNDQIENKNQSQVNNFNRQNRQNQNEEEDFKINTDQVLYVKDLINQTFVKLMETAVKYDIASLGRMLKNDIIYAILKKSAEKGEGIFVEGILSIFDEGFGLIKYRENNYANSPYDIYVSQRIIRKFGLRTGDCISGYVKDPARKGEKFFALARVEKINDKTFDEIKNKINFEDLTPIFPTEKLKFDRNIRSDEISTRIIDIMAPIGKGQRSIIVAPPRTGKTVLMKNIAHAINDNHPEVELIVLLIDERPEEVTDMTRSVKGEVVSSNFDEPAHRHIDLAEIVIEKAKRRVEDGKDVIILLDSITRLARAYNATAPSSGKILTGGVDSNALQKPKRFFGAARNLENGGSLTIIATALVETGSKMDEIIFEEFKSTGNNEIVLERKIAEKRIFPAIDISRSGTRNDEIMIQPENYQKTIILRRLISQMSGGAESAEFLIERLKKTKDNSEFFLNMNK